MPPPVSSTQNPEPSSQRPAFRDLQQAKPASSSKMIPQLKKLLIITYYWPPSGGSGVQRWLKFVKYLPSFGWQPHVFTPENPSFEIRDDTLLKDIPPQVEVIRFPIWEPYTIFSTVSKLVGKKTVSQIDLVAAGRKSLFQHITSWIRGNFFIPDARVMWVKPSVKFLENFLISNEITTIITTGPPHSLHLIGLKLKKKNPSLKWIADFRDPWSEWDLLDTLSLTDWARKKHQNLEGEVLKRADRVITIAPFHVRRLEVLSGRNVDLITNGFDEDDFAGIQKVKTKKFMIRHIGMVDELRDPKPFMLAAKTLAVASPDFSDNVVIEFIGSVNGAFREFVAQDKILSTMTVFSRPVSHADLLKLYGDTDIQLLVLAHTTLAAGNLPGKFFEYLASGNFIFGVGPENGDAAEVLRQTKGGIMIERDNAEKIKNSLQIKFEEWRRGSAEAMRDVSAFSRKELTRKLSDLIVQGLS